MEASRRSTALTSHVPLSLQRDRFEIQLLGRFELRDESGGRVQVPPSAQRIIAYLALVPRGVSRSQCAGVLWDLDTQDSANRNLRTALWRLNRVCPDLLVREQDRVGLVSDVWNDAVELASCCERVVHGKGNEESWVALLSTESELLPGWGDLWVVCERERLRLLRMHALESAATRLAPRSPDLAMLAAMAVVQAEPLQESAWRLVVSLHIRQGNLASAQRSYETYRRVLATELGARPSALMEDLVEDLRQASPTGTTGEGGTAAAALGGATVHGRLVTPA